MTVNSPVQPPDAWVRVARRVMPLRNSAGLALAALGLALVVVIFVAPDIRQPLFRGAEITVQVTLFGAAIGTGMAVLSGLLSLSPFRILRWLNRIYVDFFRGTSAIVQLFWVFFAMPLIAPYVGVIPDRIFFLTPLEAGAVVLGLNMGSYGSEVVRGAVQAVPPGQYEASIALNLSTWQRMRYVIFPQAVVGMLPPYGNLLIELLKGTALVSLISLGDLMWEAQTLRSNGRDSTTVFSAVFLLYFALALTITALVRGAERYFGRGIVTRG